MNQPAAWPPAPAPAAISPGGGGLGLPNMGQLRYVKELIIVGLLLLALPWLLRQVVTNPGVLVGAPTRKAVT